MRHDVVDHASCTLLIRGALERSGVDFICSAYALGMGDDCCPYSMKIQHVESLAMYFVLLVCPAKTSSSSVSLSC